MILLELLEAFLKLGLPVMGFSWLLFRRLYSKGEIDPALNSAELRAVLKKLKKHKMKHDDSRSARFLRSNWLSFGGGFYGVAGMWTFLYIELADFGNFIIHFPGFDAFIAKGFSGIVVDFIMNQLSNSISALLWFGYWPGESQSTLLWVAVCYFGYWAGLRMARRNIDLVAIITGKLKGKG